MPLKAWVKNALDHVIQSSMNEPSLEFVWVGDDAIDPLQQAQTLQILVTAGIKTREEARADLGLGAGGEAGAPIGKWTFDPDQPRDERGRWTVGGEPVDAKQSSNPTGQADGGRTDGDALSALVSNPVVKDAILKAWQDSTADPSYLHENGFYILQDPDSGVISVQFAKRGFAASMTFGRPPDTAIAMFHTHPNPPGSPALDANGNQFVVKGVPQVYNPGPSFEDIQASNAVGLTGIVLAYDGFYYYGPTLRWKH